MSNFSPEEYFARLSQRVDAEEAANPVQDKYLALQEARQKKVAQLDAMAKAAAQSKTAAERSWVGQVGLDPDGAPGSTLKLLAFYTYGSGRVAGQLTSLPASVASELALQGITDEHIRAYADYQKGSATKEQMALLQSPHNVATDPKQRAVPLPEDPAAYVKRVNALLA